MVQCQSEVQTDIKSTSLKNTFISYFDRMENPYIIIVHSDHNKIPIDCNRYKKRIIIFVLTFVPYLRLKWFYLHLHIHLYSEKISYEVCTFEIKM